MNFSRTPLAESTTIGSPLNRHSSYVDRSRHKHTILPLSNKAKSPVRIDSHVLSDAQSPGFVSRLVKYYGQSRSDVERNNIKYHKVGDFPIVQLRKTEIKRPIVRSSSVRIAPPSKTVLNRDARIAILRSNSFQLNNSVPKLVPVKMRAKDDAHEIITNHEPIIDTNYPASSKSVLDALEKNCRKRINNEELTLDRNKKFCTITPISAPEVVDSPKRDPPTVAVPVSAKRVREDSPTKNDKQSSDTLVQQSKRYRTKNNALLSSLSSSHYELIGSNSGALTPYHSAKSILSEAPTFPIPQKSEEPKKISPRVSVEKTNSESDVSEFEQEFEPAPRKLHLFNRKLDDNLEFNRAKLNAFQNDEKNNEDDDDDDNGLKIKFVKPKECTPGDFDPAQIVEKEKLTQMLDGLGKCFKSPVKETLSKDVVDKPEKEESVKLSSAVTSESENAESIKPAELPKTTEEPKKIESVIPATTSGFSLIKPIEFKLDTPLVKPIEVKGPETEKTTSQVVPEPISQPEVLSAVSTKPKVTFNFNPVPAATTTLAATITTSTFSPVSSILSTNIASNVTPHSILKNSNKSPVEDAAKSPALPTFSSLTSEAPKPPGFSFGSNTEAKAIFPGISTTTSSLANLVNTPKPTFDFTSQQKPVEKTAPPSFGSATIQPVTTASGIGFSFGKSTPTLFSTASTTKENTLPAPPSFNFGGSAAPFPSSEPKGGFAFSASVQKTTALDTQPQNTNPVATNPAFSFGKTPSSTSNIGGFNFGKAENPPAQKEENMFSKPADKPAFSFNLGNNTAQVTTTTQANVFGSMNQSNKSTSAPIFDNSFAKPRNEGNLFSFGNSTAPVVAPTTPSQSSFNFNLGTNSSNTNVVSPFGNNASNNPPAFGSNSSAPAFGSNNNAPIFGSSNPPAFGGNSNSNSNSNMSMSSSNAFGGQSNNTASVFSSNSAATVPQNLFGQNTQQPTSATFQFGDNKNVSASFSFSTNAPRVTQASATYNMSNSPFGSTAPIPSFQQPQQQSVGQPNVAGGGLFNIGTSGNQQRRPIRTANRRLK